jgi:hypothetical protein
MPDRDRDQTREDDLEAIVLRIHQIALTAGLLAAGQEPPVSHALYLVEESLLEVEARLERLCTIRRARPSSRRKARRT